MKKIEKCKIDYLGFSKPETPDEIELEILGLKNLICKASERISELEQSTKLAQYIIGMQNNVCSRTEEKKD